MPFKRKFKPRKFMKRRFKRRKFNTKVTNRMLTTQPIAPRALVQMRYTETLLPYLALSAAAPSFYFFNLNSIFDPNRTGSGHQPYGHDTYSTLYNRYRVYKVKWSVTLPSDSSLKYQAVIGAVNHAGTSSTLDAIAEQPGSIMRWVPPGSSSVVVSGTTSLPKLHGSTSTEYKGDDGCAAAFGNSPNEVLTLRICFYAPNAMNICPTFNLIYFTELFDPIDLAQS